MTIRELKRIVNAIPEQHLDEGVVLFKPQTVYAGSREDTYAYVTKAEYVPKCSIANGALELEKGKDFDV